MAVSSFFMQKKIKNGFDPETHKLTSYMHAGNSHTGVEDDYHVRKTQSARAKIIWLI